MGSKLGLASSLESWKKEAKSWLKALRQKSGEAHARLLRAFPDAPSAPGLRDVQHALAREQGLSGWSELKRRLISGDGADAEVEKRLSDFLGFACPDHRTRGVPQQAMARNAAMRLLRQYPDLPCRSLYSAIVCGDVDEAGRRISERPAAAEERGDVKNWTPLLYLCFARLPVPAAADNALSIARLLLDAGADPNAWFPAGDSRSTALVGVCGEGEEDRPPHPRREELVELLLERGAHPYDLQVIYDLHFHGRILWFLKLIHKHSVRKGNGVDWDDPEWRMLDMGAYGSGARYLLNIAVRRNDLELARWLLSHGASASAPPASDPRFSKRSLYEEAVRRDFNELAELLLQHGAARVRVRSAEDEEFLAACFRLDRSDVQARLRCNPQLLRSPAPLFAAAKANRRDVVALLLDVGFPVELEDAKRQRALHVAAAHDAVDVASLLIERGAQIDPVELNWQNTPLDFAVYGGKVCMIELLAPHSRDISNLTYTGHVERVREVLREDSGLARHVNVNGATPLTRLPDDEDKAVELVTLFLAHGADPGVNRKDGMTAAGIADKRGLRRAAALLRDAERPKAR